MTGSGNGNLTVALRLASAGLHVFPIANDGRRMPLIRRWSVNSTVDPAVVRTWWRVRHGALAAIDLRKAGLVVIDADRHGGPDGVAAWLDLVREHGLGGKPPIVVRTPRDGLHIYFTQPNGEPLRCRSGRLPPGIEVKGAGGSITAPDNVRDDGTFYEQIAGPAPLAAAFADGAIPVVPDWLCDLVRYQPAPPRAEPVRFAPSNGRFSAYARAALAGQAHDIAEMPINSGRNVALNAAAYRLGRFAARGWLTRGEIEQSLRHSAYTCGLVRDDGPGSVNATILSGLNAGLANPADEPGGG